MNLEPLNNIVLCEEHDGPEISTGGILLPDGSGGKDAVVAKVVAVGPGKVNEHSPEGRRIPMTVAPGDVVVFHQKSARKMPYGGREYIAVLESEVYCLITDTPGK